METMRHSELQIDWWQLNIEEKANDCSTSSRKVRRKQKKKTKFAGIKYLRSQRRIKKFNEFTRKKVHNGNSNSKVKEEN